MTETPGTVLLDTCAVIWLPVEHRAIGGTRQDVPLRRISLSLRVATVRRPTRPE